MQAFSLPGRVTLSVVCAAQCVSRSSSSGASRSTTDLSNGATPGARSQCGGAELAVHNEAVQAAPADVHLGAKSGDEGIDVD